MNAEQMRIKLQELKNEAQSFLDANNVADAESKTLEIKLLNAQIEIQDKLDLANTELENLKGDIVTKDESISNLTTELEAVKNEKSDIMEKYNDAIETVAELKAKVDEMQPIVNKFNEEEQSRKLNDAKNSYKAKFEKVGGIELFETEEIQNLIAETISDDKEVSNNAKYVLSDKIMEVIDTQDTNTLSINSIQEPSKGNKDLIPTDDEFEKVYGFKKE